MTFVALPHPSELFRILRSGSTSFGRFQLTGTFAPNTLLIRRF